MPNATDQLLSLLRKKINILIIDDEKIARYLFQQSLSSPLFHIEIASSYKQAVRIIEKKTPLHCWVVDYMLGEGKTGLDLLEEHKDFPFAILVSGHGNMEVGAKARDIGIMHIIIKERSDFLPCFKSAVYEAAALGFIAKGSLRSRTDIFHLLQNKTIRDPEQWAEAANMSERNLEMLCEKHLAFSPRKVIYLFNGMRHLLSTFGDSEPPQKVDNFTAICLEVTAQLISENQPHFLL
jgi:CheY-like chemotaxis protein